MTASHPRQIWLCRHAERMDQYDAAWQASARHPYDPPLSPTGVRHAHETAERLAKEELVHIVSSPFLRTVQMAHIIAEHLNLRVLLESGLGEILREGHFDGRPPQRASVQALTARFPTIDSTYESNIEAQYPEDHQRIQARLKRTVAQMLDRLTGDLLIVGHGASISHCSIALLGDDRAVPAPMAGLSALAQDRDGSWAVRLAGDVSHLSSSPRSQRELADQDSATAPTRTQGMQQS